MRTARSHCRRLVWRMRLTRRGGRQGEPSLGDAPLDFNGLGQVRHDPQGLDEAGVRGIVIAGLHQARGPDRPGARPAAGHPCRGSRAASRGAQPERGPSPGRGPPPEPQGPASLPVQARDRPAGAGTAGTGVAAASTAGSADCARSRFWAIELQSLHGLVLLAGRGEIILLDRREELLGLIEVASTESGLRIDQILLGLDLEPGGLLRAAEVLGPGGPLRLRPGLPDPGPAADRGPGRNPGRCTARSPVAGPRWQRQELRYKQLPTLPATLRQTDYAGSRQCLLWLYYKTCTTLERPLLYCSAGVRATPWPHRQGKTSFAGRLGPHQPGPVPPHTGTWRNSKPA